MLRSPPTTQKCTWLARTAALRFSIRVRCRRRRSSLHPAPRHSGSPCRPTTRNCTLRLRSRTRSRSSIVRHGRSSRPRARRHAAPRRVQQARHQSLRLERRQLDRRHRVTRSGVFALALMALCTAQLEAQSGGKDLPPGFRSVAGVILNRDSAVTIRAKLGATRERRIDAGHGFYYSWCYVPAGGPSRALLELMSDAGDMGTPGHALNVIRLRADVPAGDRSACAPLADSVGLSTPAGLRLGLASAQIRELLGRPTRRGAD